MIYTRHLFLNEESKVMIRQMGSVDLFELCQTIPKVQWSECLLCWNQGTVYCTCGHLLKESESSHNFHQWRLDALSIPHYVIRNGRPRDVRHGKTEAQKEHFTAHNARRTCLQKKFDGIHDRFQHIVIRNSTLAGLRRSGIEMDKLAQENHTNCPMCGEFKRFRKIGRSH